jgi:hypothetical protein
MKRVSFVLWTIMIAAGCGGGQHGARSSGPAFTCDNRHAEYMESGGIMYPEQGVRMKCAGDVPTVEEYFDDEKGKETKRSAKISAGAWEKSWSAFEGSGWRLLNDCKNAGAGDKDPIYTFEIANDDKTVSFQCQGKQLPFPYDSVLNALDSAKGELPAQDVEGP